VRMAIISDLHAFGSAPGDKEPSSLKVGDSDADARRHPISGLERLIDVEHLSAEVLLCPGDLGDAAEEAGVRHGWDMVHRVANALGDAQVIATAGNHDLTSRPREPVSHDPEQVLQSLVPIFPLDSRRAAQEYFSEHFSIVSGYVWRVVSLNSSAHHGRGEREYDFGRVTRQTRDRLTRDLEEALHEQLPPPINVLLCHHHPIEYTDVDEEDPSSIRGGALLVKELGSGRYGRWVFVHGHKHLPHIAYGPGGSAAPLIFSAGTVSANLHHAQQPHARNQFYMLTFDLEAAGRLHLPLVGTFDSWYWVGGRGWLPTDPGSGLPAHGGFGSRPDGHRLAHQILKWMASNDKPTADRGEVLDEFPELAYMIPADLELTVNSLEVLGATVRADNDGQLERLDPPVPEAQT
jgi:calcineurin-like phosphoesterase family protein